MPQQTAAEPELTLNELECVGVLPGQDNSIDIIYARIDHFEPVLHVKIHSSIGAFREVGYRRLDGGSMPENLETLQPIEHDAMSQAAKIAKTILTWGQEEIAKRAHKAKIN